MVDRTALSAAFNNTPLDMQTMKLLPSKGSSNTCDTNPYLSYTLGHVMFVSYRTEPIGNELLLALYISASYVRQEGITHNSMLTTGRRAPN
jgi:hypothetical protein